MFGAGTVQWSWGLDSEHDGDRPAPSVAMQQATVNLLADMCVQSPAVEPGLAVATASTDTTPPISAPTTRTLTVSAGQAVTVGGTAVDSGGGRVGGVEVSVDGGATWHPATTGRESWSYTWTPAVSGQVTVGSRAVDDSGNLEGRPTRGCPPPGGGTPSPPGRTTPPPVIVPTKDETAPRVRVWPRRVRVSRRRSLALRVRCPRTEQRCRIDLRLRRGSTTLARKQFTLAGGKSRRVSLRLTRAAHRRLVSSRSLAVVAVVVARDAAGNRRTTRTSIQLLAPRRG